MAPRTMSRAKDGIKRYSRVLGGFNHMLYGEADAAGAHKHVTYSMKSTLPCILNALGCICMSMCSS